MQTLKTLLLVSFYILLLLGCSTKFPIPENSTFDVNFIGKWEGDDYNIPLATNH